MTRTSEIERVEDAIQRAGNEQIRRWQPIMLDRIFNCNFGVDKQEFKRQVRTAYLLNPQYAKEICRILGVKTDEQLATSLKNKVLAGGIGLALAVIAGIIVTEYEYHVDIPKQSSAQQSPAPSILLTPTPSMQPHLASGSAPGDGDRMETTLNPAASGVDLPSLDNVNEGIKKLDALRERMKKEAK